MLEDYEVYDKKRDNCIHRGIVQTFSSMRMFLYIGKAKPATIWHIFRLMLWVILLVGEQQYKHLKRKWCMYRRAKVIWKLRDVDWNRWIDRLKQEKKDESV